MSTARKAAIARARDGLRAVHEEYDIPTHDEVAEAVVDALYPEITNAKQLLGVPEGSILVVSYRGGLHRPLIWEDGKLHGKIPGATGAVPPEQILARRSPLTVVWMP